MFFKRPSIVLKYFNPCNYLSLFFMQQQDNSHYIENEELNGFLKDLMDLVEEVRNSALMSLSVKTFVILW